PDATAHVAHVSGPGLAIPVGSRWSGAERSPAGMDRVGAAQVRFSAATAGISVDQSGSRAVHSGSGLGFYIHGF
ncbi:hypothetical protein A2U01_0054167, partial [Trifolium medium]|nr:hypothetical protein [Trifolium medium]